MVIWLYGYMVKAITIQPYNNLTMQPCNNATIQPFNPATLQQLATHKRTPLPYE
jgi:hypothetical protein